MSVCPYQETVTCELFCGKEMIRTNLQKHLREECPKRIVVCPVCGWEMEEQLRQPHEDTCSMKLIDCQFCQATNIVRSEMPSHHKIECNMFPTFCSFALVGCTEKIVRQDLQIHHTTHTQYHLRLVNSSLYHIYKNVMTGQAPPAGMEFELHSSLWTNVRSYFTGATIAWTELPGCVYNEQYEPSSDRSLLGRVEKLEKEKRKLSDTIKHLVDEKAMSTQFIKSSSDANRHLETAIQGFRDERVLSERRIKHLEEAIQESRDERVMSERRIKHLEEAIQESRDERVMSERRIKHLEEAIQKSDRHISHLEESIQHLLNDKKQFNQQMQSFSDIITRLDNDRKLSDQQSKSFSNKINKILLLPVEGEHNTCPCKWTFYVRKDMETECSPSFYTKCGYKMQFNGHWCLGDQLLRIGVIIQEGDRDDELVWPWGGTERLIVKDVTSGTNHRVLTHQNGALRPPNGYYLQYIDVTNEGVFELIFYDP